MKNSMELFGSMVFGDRVMRERLSEDVYKSMRTTINDGKDLNINVANAVAGAMKEWAIERGATHYTHWFQPMTGITAEKHDSFLSPGPDGEVLTEFSGKALIKGEPDASSFPSGGIRATFEARGYTAWDPTSYAFIKDNILYIPTAFCSYGGEALDKKTPLLRSMEVLNKQAMRILRLFNNTTSGSVKSTVGAEQEYFLVRRDHYRQRKDLLFTGRTLFGAKPPKGQELDDHYFGSINSGVKEFMEDLNTELWKIGIYAKTEHREVAPGQYELVPVFATANIATDQNQLTMELMKKVAARHEFACLLHEKPFAGVNGSGKHNNWALATDDGINLLESGETPRENAQFLLFLAAFIVAVDHYQDLLRVSVATAGNDHRLGANEAPPAIISIFLGDELTSVLDAIENDSDYENAKALMMEVGVDVLPRFPKDTTDRNRTSPLAFTGDKFEFRMLGAALSIAEPNIILNTIVADELSKFADELEAAEDFDTALVRIMKDTIKDHGRIIFNGNNYSDDWVREAEARGLYNLKTTADALPLFKAEKNIELFTKHKIFTESEIYSRCEIMFETYTKTIKIEANTMVGMARRYIIPAAVKYMKMLADTIHAKRRVNEKISAQTEEGTLAAIAELTDDMYHALTVLEGAVSEVEQESSNEEMANYCKDKILPAMDALRLPADQIEGMVAKEFWPYPTLDKLMFGVNFTE